jgi:hypothetical protein
MLFIYKIIFFFYNLFLIKFKIILNMSTTELASALLKQAKKVFTLKDIIKPKYIEHKNLYEICS